MIQKCFKNIFENFNETNESDGYYNLNSDFLLLTKFSIFKLDSSVNRST